MRRSWLLVLLGLGSVAGFAAGFSGLREHRAYWGAPWSERRLDAVAEACVRAAERIHSAERSDSAQRSQTEQQSDPSAAPAPPAGAAVP